MTDEPRKIVETKLDLNAAAKPKLDAAEATEKIRAARSRPREESVDLTGVRQAAAERRAGDRAAADATTVATAAPAASTGGPDGRRRTAKETVSLAITLWLAAAIIGGIAAVFAWHPGASGVTNEAFVDAGATSEVKTRLEDLACRPMQLDWQKLPESADRARAALTGTAREEFDKTFETNRSIIEQTRATLTCRVDTLAVSSLTDDRAVLLAILVTTTSIGGQQAETMVPRAQYTMVKDNGQWLISDVADV